jgi:hypothetical protein
MALPTVYYHRIAPGTDSSLHSEVFPILHGLLDDAGWTTQFIDSDAIGTGSSSAPAWDKTPTVNETAGRAIYSMPANDHSRVWYVQLIPRWGGNVTSNMSLSARIGTGIDGSNELTGAGTEVTWQSSAASNSLPVMFSVSEDGLALVYDSNSGVTTTNVNTFRFVLIERMREFDGTVSDDLGMTGYAAAGSFGDGSQIFGCFSYRASDGLEYAVNTTAMLTGHGTSLTNTGTFTTYSLTSADGETGMPAGPFVSSGRVWGLPRLLLTMFSSDVVVNTDHPVSVDGGVKLYRVLTNFPPSHIGCMVARE